MASEIHYACDPAKNRLCKKQGCYLNGGGCSLTRRSRCAELDENGLPLVAFRTRGEGIKLYFKAWMKLSKEERERWKRFSAYAIAVGKSSQSEKESSASSRLTIPTEDSSRQDDTTRESVESKVNV